MKQICALGLALLVNVSRLAATTDTSIELCLPEVGALVQHANASFPVIVEFTIDATGHPSGVVVREARLIDAQKLQGCVTAWRLGGQPAGARFTAKWQWLHGTGWDHLLIEGPDFRQRIVLSGDHCYYCPDRATPSNSPLDPAAASGDRGSTALRSADSR